MLQHGDFFENLAVAAATVPRESFAADEKLRDSFFACNIAEYFWSYGFRSNCILLLESICVRDLVVASDLSAPDQMIQYLGQSSRQLLSLNQKKKISSSFQSHPVSTHICARSGQQIARWAENL